MVAAKELREKEIETWISAVLSQEQRWCEVRLAAFPYVARILCVAACLVQLGNEWKLPPVKEDSRWDIVPRGELIKTLLVNALVFENDRLQAVADVMQSWDNDGVAGIRVSAEQLHCYMKKLLNGTLTAPRINSKTNPPSRLIITAIPAARLLKRRLPEIRTQLEKTFTFDRRRPPTKEEMAKQAERREEQLEDEVATLQVERYCHHSACRTMVPMHAARTRGPFPAPPQYSMVQHGTV